MAEEPIVRITDQAHLRAKILEQRDGGDPRWQQKWDDLDAFPYNASVQHQQEWMVDHPVFAGFLQSVSKPEPPAPKAAAPLPPAQKYLDKVAVPPRQQVDPRAAAAQSPLNKWMPPEAAKSFGGGPPVPQPPMRPSMQGPAQGQYTPPPPTRPYDLQSYLAQYGLDKWMPPETAGLFRKR